MKCPECDSGQVDYVGGSGNSTQDATGNEYNFSEEYYSCRDCGHGWTEKHSSTRKLPQYKFV